MEHSLYSIMKPFVFFLQPDLEKSDGFGVKLSNIWDVLQFGIIGYLFFIFILFADHLLSASLHYDSVVKETLGKYVSRLKDLSKMKLILSGIIVVPLIEEMAFRSFMNFKKINLVLSPGILAYIVLTTFFSLPFYKINNRIVTISFSLLLMIGTYIFIKENFLAKLRIHFHLLFYISNILFVLLHISNYNVEAFGIANYLALPIVLMPQVIGSINFSYIRIRNGLVWSIAIHCFYNTIFLLPLLLK
jgi:hypothetical protein